MKHRPGMCARWIKHKGVEGDHTDTECQFSRAKTRLQAENTLSLSICKRKSDNAKATTSKCGCFLVVILEVVDTLGFPCFPYDTIKAGVLNFALGFRPPPAQPTPPQVRYFGAEAAPKVTFFRSGVVSAQCQALWLLLAPWLRRSKNPRGHRIKDSPVFAKSALQHGVAIGGILWVWLKVGVAQS